MHSKELHTDRLILRELTPEVYDHIHETMGNIELMDFLGLASAEDLAIEKEKYSKGLATHNRTFVHFQLIEKTSGRVIGGCGYHTWFPKHCRAEIGYDLKHEDDMRKGYMTEALRTVLDYGFKEMELHRVEALAAPDNEPSLKLLKKSGFVFEGTLREHYNVGGTMEDSVMYSLLKHEFKNI
jgi:ribosomal-protein-alanine N-acetyltransferase